ncbi:ATP-dependent RNA helicase DeaD [compost metagenome]
MPRIMDEFAELSKDEVIKRFASLEFNRFLEYYKNAPDLNSSADDRGERGERGERGPRSSEGYTRLFINLGSVDDFTRGDLLSFVCNNGKISGKGIGKIDLKGVYSFFEVENAAVESLFNNFKGVEFNNRGVRIEKTADGDGGGGGRSRGGFGGGGRREGGGGERRSYGGGNRREGGNSGGGFRDFSGRSREDKGGAGRREGGNSGGSDRRRRS